MPKAICIEGPLGVKGHDVTFYTGETYDVPKAILDEHPENFEVVKASKPKAKKASNKAKAAKKG